MTGPSLADWVDRYRSEADVRQALMLGGGVSDPGGGFYDDSMQLLETGLFDGFERLHVAGHPEGNRDIEPAGQDVLSCMRCAGSRISRAAPAWRWPSSRNSRSRPRRSSPGATVCAPRNYLPVHLGVAGPAKLQTLIKFAVACGVGPSLKVLQKRAKDVSKLLLPFEPTELVQALAAHKAAHPDFAVERLHFFPLGGIKTNATWTATHGGASARPGPVTFIIWNAHDPHCHRIRHQDRHHRF